MSAGFDLQGYINELEEIREKYGIDKGYFYVPDSIQFKVDRISKENLTVHYSETFSYLPDVLLQHALTVAINMLSMMGIPRENISKIPKGVAVTLSGDARFLMVPLIEVLIQSPYLVKDIQLIADKMVSQVNNIQRLNEMTWNYNPKILESIRKLGEVLLKHPELNDKFKELAEKYQADTLEV